MGIEEYGYQKFIFPLACKRLSYALALNSIPYHLTIGVTVEQKRGFQS